MASRYDPWRDLQRCALADAVQAAELEGGPMIRLATDAELADLAEDLAESWRRDGADAREDIEEARRQREAGEAAELHLVGAARVIHATRTRSKSSSPKSPRCAYAMGALRHVVDAAGKEAVRQARALGLSCVCVGAWNGMSDGAAHGIAVATALGLPVVLHRTWLAP